MLTRAGGGVSTQPHGLADNWTGNWNDDQAQEGDQHGGSGMPAFLWQDAAKKEEI